jgi:uncharacterized protein YkwD
VGLVVLSASLLLALWGYPYAAGLFRGRASPGNPWILPLAFLGTFVLLRLLLGAVADRLVAAVPHRGHVHPANRALGLLPSIVDGLLHAMILALLLLLLLLLLLSRPLHDGLSAQTQESRIAARLAVPAEWIEARLTPIFEPAVSKTMNRMVVKPESRESVPLSFSVRDPKPRPDLEAGMLNLLNEERAAHGLRPLQADPELAEVARAHSRDMVVRGYFSHVAPEGKDPFDRMRQAKVKYLAAGENLALAPTLAMAHQGLMNSPGHRANILLPLSAGWASASSMGAGTGRW